MRRTLIDRELLGSGITIFLIGAFLGVLGGYYAFRVRYDPDTKVPEVVRTVAGEIFEPGYVEVPLADLATGHRRPNKARIRGTVTNIQREPDGDHHVVIGDAEGYRIVGEVIPELPMPIPIEGTEVEVWGITRFDYGHAWWEIHPIVGWRPIRSSVGSSP